ncbi:MAG: CU044_5270 family protein [Acidimicrobiales bacterium]
MPELSERIRDYVDEACPAVTIDEITSRLGVRDVAPQGRGPTSRRLALLSAAVVAILVVVLVVQLLPGSGPQAGTEAEAALARLASVAAAQPVGVVPGPGHYLYYETSQTMTGATPQSAGAQQFLFREAQTTQTWVAPDGSGRQRIATSEPQLVFPAQHAAWVAAGSPQPFLQVPGVDDTLYPSTRSPVGGPLVMASGAYRLSYLDSSKFPTQPAALQRYMDRSFKIDDNSRSATLQLAANVLQVGARPALRSAVFELIEHLRGVTLLGTTKDPRGRTGTGVAVEERGSRTILVFDPTTSAVLGERSVSVRSVHHGGVAIPKGTVVSAETFGVTGTTGSTGRYPNGQLAPPYQGDTRAGTPNGAIFVPGG